MLNVFSFSFFLLLRYCVCGSSLLVGLPVDSICWWSRKSRAFTEDWSHRLKLDLIFLLISILYSGCQFSGVIINLSELFLIHVYCVNPLKVVIRWASYQRPGNISCFMWVTLGVVSEGGIFVCVPSIGFITPVRGLTRLGIKISMLSPVIIPGAWENLFLRRSYF